MAKRKERKKYRDNRQGSNHWNAKLTENNVIVIRSLYKQGSTIIDLANIYKVSWTCIFDVVNYITWRHIR